MLVHLWPPFIWDKSCFSRKFNLKTYNYGRIVCAHQTIREKAFVATGHPFPPLQKGRLAGREDWPVCVMKFREGKKGFSWRSCIWTHLMSFKTHMGESNGTPLQYSCLENPRDGGARWAAVYGVAQSRTRLKRLSSSSSRVQWCQRDVMYMWQATVCASLHEMPLILKNFSLSFLTGRENDVFFLLDHSKLTCFSPYCYFKKNCWCEVY